MKKYFLLLTLLLLPFLTTHAVNETQKLPFTLPQTCTHSVADVDLDTSSLLLNDGKVWSLLDSGESIIISYKKGYLPLQKNLWKKGAQLYMKPVYMDKNGYISEKTYFPLPRKTPFYMFYFYTGEEDSLMTPGTRVSSYVKQGPFFCNEQ